MAGMSEDISCDDSGQENYSLASGDQGHQMGKKRPCLIRNSDAESDRGRESLIMNSDAESDRGRERERPPPSPVGFILTPAQRALQVSQH